MIGYEIANSRILDIMNIYFQTNFEVKYNNIALTGKSKILKYGAAFFRKWYYSTLVEDTLITPCYIAEHDDKSSNIFPVIKNGSIKRIGSIKINNIRFSLENHPITNDFRLLVNAFRNGIVLDDELQMEFEDIKNIGDITSYDGEYINYITMLAIDTGYIEKMPSVGVSMFCASKKADILENKDNKTLLDELINAAIKIASSYLSDDFMGERYRVTDSMIKDWLINPRPVDNIYEEAYGELALDVTDLMSVDSMDDMERAVTAKAYARGVIMDKWFLTPFSFYFRFINSTYMYEYSFEEELAYFINAVKMCGEYFEDAVVSSSLYSPPTFYKLSRLGAEYFGVEFNNDLPYIFKNMSCQEVLNAALYDGNAGRKKIIGAYEPDFEVYDLKISSEEFKEYWFILQVRGTMTLAELHTTIADIIGTDSIFCQSYRFYKLPQSPFTDYTPKFMEQRGPHTENTSISSVLEKGEKCYYETVEFDNEEEDINIIFEIELMGISTNKKGEKYPKISGGSKKIFS